MCQDPGSTLVWNRAPIFLHLAPELESGLRVTGLTIFAGSCRRCGVTNLRVSMSDPESDPVSVLIAYVFLVALFAANE